jgi:hypothetical protein
MDRIPSSVRYKHKNLLIALSSILACLLLPGDHNPQALTILPAIPQIFDIEVDRLITTNEGLHVGYTDPMWEQLLQGIDLDKIWEFIDSEYVCEGNKPSLILFDNLTKRNLKFFFLGGLFKYSDMVEENSGLRVELFEPNDPENPAGIVVINMGNISPLLSLSDRPRHLFYSTLIALIFHELLHACQIDEVSMINILDRQASEEYAYGLSFAIEQLMKDIKISENRKENRDENKYKRDKIVRDIITKRTSNITMADLRKIENSFNTSSISTHYGFDINIQIPSKTRYRHLKETLDEIVEDLES